MHLLADVVFRTPRTVGVFIMRDNKQLVSELVEIGNEVKGHRINGSNKAEIKKNIRRVFANARQRSEARNIMG